MFWVTVGLGVGLGTLHLNRLPPLCCSVVNFKVAITCQCCRHRLLTESGAVVTGAVVTCRFPLVLPSVLAASLLAFIISSNIFLLTFFVVKGMLIRYQRNFLPKSVFC